MNQCHAWPPPSRLHEYFLRMISKGGEEVVVNPLALLCFTDSIVFVSAGFTADAAAQKRSGGDGKAGPLAAFNGR